MTLDELKMLAVASIRSPLSDPYSKDYANVLIKLIAVAQAAASVACEDDVRDALLCHNQGVAVLEALKALRDAVEKPC